jgi:hypothetical protein
MVSGSGTDRRASACAPQPPPAAPLERVRSVDDQAALRLTCRQAVTRRAQITQKSVGLRRVDAAVFLRTRLAVRIHRCGKDPALVGGRPGPNVILRSTCRVRPCRGLAA